MAKTEVTKTEDTSFVNPFNVGVSYEAFAKAKGDKSVKEYLSGKEKFAGERFNNADFDWLENELSLHGYSKENAEEFEAIHKQEHKDLTTPKKDK